MCARTILAFYEIKEVNLIKRRGHGEEGTSSGDPNPRNLVNQKGTLSFLTSGVGVRNVSV